MAASTNSKTIKEKDEMNPAVEYHKPVIVDLGSLKEVIRGAHLKGHRGIFENLHWKMIPAYDLDE
jgi:hypothetical protein